MICCAQVLEAGTFAANGGNMQSWRFLVIRDSAIKAAAGAWYQKAWHEVVGPRYRSGGPAPGTTPERFARMLAAAEYLADHFHEAPVWIVPCLAGLAVSGSSIFPGGAEHAAGVPGSGAGTTLTTLYLMHEKEAEAAMGIPGGVSFLRNFAGWVSGRGSSGPVRRAPLAEVVYQDKWGQAFPAG